LKKYKRRRRNKVLFGS